MVLIKLREVSRIYSLGEVKVYAPVEFSADIEAGEYVARVGPSGAGSSHG